MGRVNITIIAGILFLFYSLKGDCHNVNYEKIILHEWTLNDHEKIKGSFLMYKNDSVYIQLENEQTVRYSMSDFSKNDQQFVMQRYKRIQQLNSQQIPAAINGASEKPVFPFSKISIAGLALLIIFLCIYFFGGKNKLRNISLDRKSTRLNSSHSSVSRMPSSA